MRATSSRRTRSVHAGAAATTDEAVVREARRLTGRRAVLRTRVGRVQRAARLGEPSIGRVPMPDGLVMLERVLGRLDAFRQRALRYALEISDARVPPPLRLPKLHVEELRRLREALGIDARLERVPPALRDPSTTRAIVEPCPSA